MTSVLKYVVVFFLQIRGGRGGKNKSGTMDVNVTTAQSKSGYSKSMPTSTAIILEELKSLNIRISLTNMKFQSLNMTLTLAPEKF